MERREFFGLLAVGCAVTLTACSSSQPVSEPSLSPSASPKPKPRPSPTPHPKPKPRPSDGASGSLPPIPEPNPGSPNILLGGPTADNRVAITIDDGYAPDVVAAYVDFAQQTGMAITFSPNGTYNGVWDQHAHTLAPLIESGQVQIGNHTYTHRSIVTRSAAAVRADIEQNDDWIRSTFGITSRPYFRPPYGSHNKRTDQLVADLGYTSILMWNGSFGDSTVQRPRTIMALAERYLYPGTVILGHANHPAIIPLLPMIHDLINSRGLKPSTLDQMFGTSRATG